MRQQTHRQKWRPPVRRSLIISFRDDEQGGVTVFLTVLFVGIVLTTGIALDLLRHESERAELQDALDRGVLAAASLTQTMPAEPVIRSFIDRRNYSSIPAQIEVYESPPDEDYRRVTARADLGLGTFFLNMAGMDDLPVATGSDAVESRKKVEVSLVVDISGSMAREYSGNSGRKRLDVMRTSAASFVDLILAEDNRENTTLSLIPYAGQVNAGPLFDRYNSGRSHYNSSCIEFSNGDFTAGKMPNPNSQSQVPHFQWFTFEGGRGHEADWGWCPDNAKPLVPISNDPVALRNNIMALRGHDGTGTQIGMKWGLALLDPDTNDAVSGMLPEEFADRPLDYRSDRSLKVIVLMTDGNTRYQQRPYGSGWLLNSSSKRNNDELQRRDQLSALCTLAKESGVVVFTIGFDVGLGSNAYSDMKACATSESHFYHVSGLDLEAAFNEIASTISKLKLVG